jgi:transcriptional regulator with XRE-family HTH domain
MESVYEGKEFKTILGKKIKRLRKLNDVTQEDLRKALGLNSSGMISQVEDGTKGLKKENIVRAAAFFGVHPIVLFSPVDMSKEDLEMMNGIMKLIEKKNTSAENKSYYNTIRKLLA